MQDTSRGTGFFEEFDQELHITLQFIPHGESRTIEDTS